MRKLIVAALVGCLALVLAAVAVAATEQNYSQNYSSKKVKTSVGTTFSTDSVDPANTENNKQPNRVTNFDITFPKGTKIDYKAIPTCNATEDDFAAQDDSDDACPKGSKVGSGTVKASLPYNGTAELTGTVDAYNAKNSLLLYVQIASPLGNQTLLIKGSLKGTLLKTTVPRNCIPPGVPSNGCKDGSGVSRDAILTEFTLKTKKAGSSKKPFMRSPATCPASKTWLFKAKLTYADGTSANKTATTPCSK
jgi:hypothetical protein